MGPSEDTPAAFRRIPAAASFIGLDDDQVLNIARAALVTVQTFPVGSPQREAQWARFDNAMAELAGRGLRHVLAKLRERGDL